MALTWIPLMILTILLHGTGNVLTKKGTTRLGSPGMLFLLSVTMFIIYGSVYLLFRPEHTPFYGICSCAAATLLSAVGYIFFYEAVERQKISIVGVITAAYPFVVVILAVLFLDETLTIPHIAALGLIIASVSLLSYTPGHSIQRSSWLLFAVLSFVLWGISTVIAKFAIDTTGPVVYVGVYALSGPPVWLLYWFFKSKKIHLTRKDVEAELSVIFFCFGSLFFYAAINYGYVSIITAFSNVYPFVTVGVARIMLAERLKRHHQIAVSMALLGITLLAL